jgi:hypothetical protein
MLRWLLFIIKKLADYQIKKNKWESSIRFFFRTP